MSLFTEKFGRLFGKKKNVVKKQQKRMFHLEPLEERHLLAVVTLDGTDLTASEAPTSTSANWGYVTLRRDTVDASALTVSYEVLGTALHVTDYQGLGLSYSHIDNASGQQVYRGTTTIPANQATTAITIKPINDALKEPTETVVLRLLNGDDDGYGGSPYALGSTIAQTINITDNDNWTVNVTATDATGSEKQSGETQDPITFRFTRSGESDLTTAMTVYYRLSETATRGTDYNVSTGAYDSYANYGYVSIPAGQSYVDLALNIVDDSATEPTETVLLTLLDQSPTGGYGGASGLAYNLGAQNSASATIADNDAASPWTVNIQATDAIGKETNVGETVDTITYRFTRSGSSDLSQPLKVYYDLTGTAYAGSDYSSPANYLFDDYDCVYWGYVMIPAGQTTVDLTLNVINDAAIEPTETVTLRLLENCPEYYMGLNLGYAVGTNKTANANIEDNDNVLQISAGGPYTVDEGGTVTLNASKVADPFNAGPWTYTWDLDGDGVFGETGTNAKNGNETGQSVVFSAAGLNGPVTKKVTVKMVDSQSHTTTAMVDITVKNAKPVVTITGATESTANTLLSWSGSFVDSGSDTWSVTVNYGDNSTPATITPAGNKTFPFSHRYTADGIYNMTITLSDGSESTVVTKKIIIGDVMPVMQVKLVSSGSVIASGSTMTFGSTPYGTAKIFEFSISNSGRTNMELDVINATLPPGVTFKTMPAMTVKPGEITKFELKWDGKKALNSNFVLLSNSKTPTYTLKLTGTVTALTNGPSIGDFKLVKDTGTSATDEITYNPIVAGKVNGTFADGYAKIEFDHNNDGKADGFANVYVTGGTFTYDPSTDPTWPVVTSGTKAVTLKYRVVHLDPFDENISTGTWASFAYTLQPPPAGTLVVSGLATEKGTLVGDWNAPGSVAVKGAVSGSGTRFVEVMINDTLVTRVRGTIDNYGNFKIDLPQGMNYGAASTIKARALTYSSTEQMNLAGAWVTLNVTPTVPTIATLALKKDDGTSSTDGISSDVTISGTLTNMIGAAFAEIEFYNGSTIYGRTFADKEGKFEYVPKGTAVSSGQTFYTRVVKKNASAANVYGTAKTVYAKYAPVTPSAVSTIVLDAPKTTGSTITTDPVLTAKTTTHVGLDLMFEYSYKIGAASTWSTGELVSGMAIIPENADPNRTTDVYESSYRIPGLHTITTSTTSVTLQVRTVVWDAVKNDYVYGSWKTLSFTYEKAQDALVVVDTLKVETLTDAANSKTTDPAIIGSITNDGEVAGLRVEIYQGTTLLGTTTTDANGHFFYRPTGLTPGAVTLSVKVREWNVITKQDQYSTSKNVSFTLLAKTVKAPTVTGLTLWDDTGTAGDNATANAWVSGKITDDGDALNRVLIEFDTNSDGTAEGTAYTGTDGSFQFLPTLATGAKTVKIRAARYDVNTNAFVYGAWSTFNLTVQTPNASWVPNVKTVSTAFGEANGQGVMMTTDPAIKGRLTSEGGFENLKMQFDLDGNGSVEYEAVPDKLGQFAWRPTIDLGTNQQKTVTVKMRAGKVNTVTQAVTWGNWTTYTYIYTKPTVTPGTLDTWSITSEWVGYDDYGYDQYDTKFGGTVTAGIDVLGVSVELDYTDDDRVDGIAIPGPDGTFAFEVTPGKTNVRARVVETIANGSSTTRREGAWQTKTYNGTLATSKASPALDVTGGTSAAINGLKIDGYKSGMSLSYALDIDGNGSSDISLTPNSSGKVTMTSILSAIAQADNDGMLENLHGGLIMVSAWLEGYSEHTTEHLTFPIVYQKNLTPTEQVTFANKQKEFAQKYAEYETAVNEANQASQTGNYAVETQYYDGTIIDTGTDGGDTGDGTSTGTGSLTTFDPGLTQSDILKLDNAPAPPISMPVFSGETVAVENDPAVKDAIAAAIKTYDQTVLAQQKQLNASYETLLANHNTAMAKLTSDYEAAKLRNESEVNALVDVAVESTSKYSEISSMFSAHSTEASAARTAALVGVTDEAVRRNIEYDYQIKYIEIERDRKIALANWKYELACGANSTLEKKIQLADRNADAEETFANAAADAIKTLNDNIAALAYQNKLEQTAAWEQQVNSMYATLAAAINNWQNSGAGEQLWKDYIGDLYDHMVTRINADNAAYSVHANGAANAEKALADAINEAWNTAQKASNSAAKSANKSANANQKAFVKEAQAAIRKHDVDLEKNESEHKIKLQSLLHKYTTVVVKTYEDYYYNNTYTSQEDRIEAFFEAHDTLWDAIKTRDQGLNSQIKKYRDKSAEISNTFRNDLIDAVAGYLCGSTDVGADYSKALLSIAEGYEGDTVGASDGYNGIMVGADKGLQTSLLGNADTQNGEDIDSEEDYLDGMMSGYISSILSWANGQNNAYGDYVRANANAEKTHFDSVLGAAVTYVNAVFDKGKEEATTSINTLAGLAESTAGAISGFLNDWIGASYGGERGYTDADRGLSKDNIGSAAAYLKAESAIDKDEECEKNKVYFDRQDDCIDYYLKKCQSQIDDAFASYGYLEHYFLYPYSPAPEAFRSSFDVALMPLVDNAVSLRNQAIKDNSDTEKKEAYTTYIGDVWGNEETYLTTCFDIASGLLDSWYNGLDGLEGDVESATGSSNSALQSAAKDADTTGDMITYMKSVANTDVEYAKQLEKNVGVYQQAWRQDVFNGLVPNDPARGLWQSEIIWAGKVAGARDAYTLGLSNASLAYTNTTLDAYGAFNSAMWNASDAYNNGMFGASSAYSSSMRSANKMFAGANFSAEKSHTMAIFAAAKSESLANAAAEQDAANTLAVASQTAANTASASIDQLMSNLGNLDDDYDFNDWKTEAANTSTAMTSLLNTENTARYQRVNASNQQLANAKSQNALTKKNADDAANHTFESATSIAGVDHSLASFGAASTYLTTIIGIESTYNNSADSAYDTYITTESNAWKKYVKTSNALDTAYFSALEQLKSNPNFDAATYVQQAANSASNGGSGVDVQPFGGNTTGDGKRPPRIDYGIHPDRMKDFDRKAQSALELNRVIITQHAIQNDHLQTEIKIDYANKTADTLIEVQKLLASVPLSIIGGAFVQKGTEILIKTTDGKVIGRVARCVIWCYGKTDEAIEALNLAGNLLNKKNIWSKGSFTTPEESLIYHYNKHGAELGAKSMDQYLNQSEQFSKNLRGAVSHMVGGANSGIRRYKKLGKYIDINIVNKKIISFGIQ